MTTYTSDQAAAGYPVFKPLGAGVKAVAIGTIPDVGASASTAPVTTGPLIGDIYRMLKLPKGAVVIGGRAFGSRMSSGTSYGSSSLAFNVGFSGAIKSLAGTSYGATTTSNALGALQVDYAAITGLKTESGMNMMLGGLLYTIGPLELSEEQYVQLTVTGSAVSFVSAAALSLEVEYYVK